MSNIERQPRYIYPTPDEFFLGQNYEEREKELASDGDDWENCARLALAAGDEEMLAKISEDFDYLRTREAKHVEKSVLDDIESL